MVREARPDVKARKRTGVGRGREHKNPDAQTPVQRTNRRPEDIIKASAAILGFPVEHLLARTYDPDTILCRMATMWVCRELTGCSYPELGRAFYRDHATIINGVRKAEVDPAVQEIVEEILEGLENGE